jgi:multicomponent Na+:H+ antiporter subunit G
MIEWIVEALSGVILVAGAFFVFVAGVGVWRLPDVYSRMHANSKASALGLGLILISSCLIFLEIWVVTRLIFILVFIFLTTPLAAHVLSRAAYLSGLPVAPTSKLDEYGGKNAR